MNLPSPDRLAVAARSCYTDEAVSVVGYSAEREPCSAENAALIKPEQMATRL
jgi:hypothetical protein